MEHFGNRIAELRKSLGLSQKQIADLLGISQASVSRLEASEHCPADIRLLTKLARALKVQLKDILPEERLNELSLSDAQKFVAFCPNAFCPANASDPRDYEESDWPSQHTFEATEFDETNFCGSCGSELIKECPDCKKRLSTKFVRFCVRCGTEICQKPTRQQMEFDRAMADPPEEETSSSRKPSVSTIKSPPKADVLSDYVEDDNIPF